jgi:hypothetical protein
MDNEDLLIPPQQPQKENTLLAKYGAFDFDETQKQQQEALVKPLVTNIDRVLTNNGVLKYYNKFLKPKSEKVQTSINYVRFCKVVDSLNGINPQIKLEYTQVEKRFDQQGDELIDYFKGTFAPKTVDKLNPKEMKMILTQVVSENIYEEEGIIVDLVSSRVGIAELALVYPMNLKELGLGRKEKLSGMSTLAVKKIFNHIAQQSGYKVEKDE